MKFSRMVLVMCMVLIAAACGTSVGHVDAEQAAARTIYDAESSIFLSSVKAIVAAKTDGRMTQAQWDSFKVDERSARQADITAYALLQEWESTGRKPPAYDAAAATLRAAQNKVAAIAAEVSR